MDETEKLEPLRVFLTAFILSSFGGLAALLRSNAKLTLRSIFAAVFYSGLAGLVIALLWYRYFDAAGNVYFLLGISALAGIGGTTVIDFLLQSLLRVIKSGGLNITLGPGGMPVDPPANRGKGRGTKAKPETDDDDEPADDGAGRDPKE